MIIKVTYNGEYNDSIIFEADDIEEAKKIAYEECDKRGWNIDKCYSEIKR